MIIFKKASSLGEYIKKQKNAGKKIGFVPTMGALHEGHLTLIRESRMRDELTVSSIFINPTQFNNPEDLKHYPVTLEKDMEQLVKAGSDLLFLPTVEEIYPDGFHHKTYQLGEIEKILEGKYRPGHFQGVCQVVDRLLDIVKPDDLYLGQKDFQQCLVIAKLLQLTGRQDTINIRIIPTVREDDGLAMSSRNLRLNPEQRKKATGIFEILNFIRQNKDSRSLETLEQEASNRLTSKGFLVDYVQILNSSTLGQPNGTSKNVALVAASLGPVRLIDNMLLN